MERKKQVKRVSGEGCFLFLIFPFSIRRGGWRRDSLPAPATAGEGEERLTVVAGGGVSLPVGRQVER
jgi:hypothetical protein